MVETALSIQFDMLREFRATHFGMFYPLVGERFPVTEDHPRLDPIVERFPFPIQRPSFRIAPAGGEVGRVWFRDAVDGCAMLQLQPDRFGFNWCRKEGIEYPRYGFNRPRLFEEFERFQKFCADAGLGEAKPNLCEVIYVNHIKPGVDETLADCFAAVFTGVEWKSSDGWLQQSPNIVSFNRVFTIGEQKGRLYAQAGIAREETQGDFIRLKITARVIHSPGEELRENLDLAHEWVVKSFVSLTETDARKERWGQEE